MEIDIEKMRIELKEVDAKRDAGLVEPTSIEKFRDISYGPHGVRILWMFTIQLEQTKITTNSYSWGILYSDKELYRFYTMFLATRLYGN